MEELKTIFSSFGLKNVQTYIQSGNVLFDSAEKNAQTLTKKIENGLQKSLSYKVTVVLRTKSELEQTIKRNPFPKLQPEKEKRLYVTFLSGEPESAQKKELLNSPNDVESYEIIGREVYILCDAKGFGSTKFNNNYIEKKLALSATTRNWNTVNKLVGLAQK